MKRTDKRMFDKMVEKRIPSVLLAEKLKAKGHNVSGKDIFNIAMRSARADIQLQDDIADILGCTRTDIF